MFALKKILGHLLMPLPLALALFTIGLWLLVRGGKARRRAAAALALSLGWAILAVGGNRGVSAALTSSLENHYKPAPSSASAPAAAANAREPSAPPAEAWPPGLADAGFVAVLGGGHGDASSLSAGQRLSPSARARLMEGIRLALALPGAWLVVSGPRAGFDTRETETSPPTHARVLADAAVESGFPRERIVEIDTARDTAEEIAALRRLAGEENVALVTSAWHLPRAMKLAHAEGLAAFPCPSDYLGSRNARTDFLDWLIWDADSLTGTTRAWREYLGQAWASLVAWWRR